MDVAQPTAMSGNGVQISENMGNFKCEALLARILDWSLERRARFISLRLLISLTDWLHLRNKHNLHNV